MTRDVAQRNVRVRDRTGERIAVQNSQQNQRRLRQALALLLWVLPLTVALRTIRHITSAKAPETLQWQADKGHRRWGLTEPQRQAIFADIASHDLEYWRLSARWPDAWSRHDDYMIYISREVKALATQYKVTPSAVFLVYDEGIHAGWSDNTGHRLDGGWVPLKPRTE